MFGSRRSPRPLCCALLLALARSAATFAGNSDGQIDSSFGDAGKVTWYDGGQVTVADLATSSTTAYAVGKVTLVGEAAALHFRGFDSGGNELNQGCAQTSDTLFTLATESNGLAGLVDSSGGLLVGGWAAFFGSETTHRALIARFDLSGTGCVLDDNFSGNGWAIFDDDTWCDNEQCDVLDLVEIRPLTGAVVAPRIVALVRSDTVATDPRLFLLGLTSSGAIDTGFDGNGWREVTEPGIGVLYGLGSLAVDGLGRIYVYGSRFDPQDASDSDPFVFRFLANGAADTSFGNTGYGAQLNGGSPDGNNALSRDGAISADGFSLYAFQADDNNAFLLTYRSEAVGSGTPLEQLRIAAVAAQGNGRVVMVGEPGDGSDGFLLTRKTLGPLGEIDQDLSFGGGTGAQSFDIDLGGTNSETASAVAIWNGRALVAGTAKSSVGDAGFLLRTQNYFVFADGFEQGTAASWSDSTGVVFPD